MVGRVSLATLVALLSLCLAVQGDKFDEKYGRHNITQGMRRLYPNYPVDVLLFHDTPKVDGSWFPYPKVKSHDVCYTSAGTGNRKFSITAFNVTDQIPGGDGGLAYVTGGGVNSGKLCLHLKTQRSKGYNFIIDIWGYFI
ncbi:uncharacterized protein LOC124354584 [Homalodisca vitripennis]|uniref:uncharacterized protein LOC124354584 n=1 Tax=Homalodisca vitripennis TaxID=197043 RepID=UPI001EEBA154|nr:uncharacterized protein LOC124354584 [Homalodisca vitripennis]KAG8257056.1 hypothetical protein J6590_057126 [Homalodisca vitripennis]